LGCAIGEVDVVRMSVNGIRAVINVDVSEHPHLLSYKNDTILGYLTGLQFSVDPGKTNKSDISQLLFFYSMP
jgi:hypothetical protein